MNWKSLTFLLRVFNSVKRNNRLDFFLSFSLISFSFCKHVFMLNLRIYFIHSAYRFVQWTQHMYYINLNFNTGLSKPKYVNHIFLQIIWFNVAVFVTSKSERYFLCSIHMLIRIFSSRVFILTRRSFTPIFCRVFLSTRQLLLSDESYGSNEIKCSKSPSRDRVWNSITDQRRLCFREINKRQVCVALSPAVLVL